MKPLRVVCSVIATVMIVIGTVPSIVPTNASLLAQPALAMTPSNPHTGEISSQRASPDVDTFTSSKIPVPIPETELDRIADRGSSELVAVADVQVGDPWMVTVQAGQTLDELLGEVGLNARQRSEIATALTVEYDARRIRPGHQLSVAFGDNGAPEAISLAVDDGVRIDMDLRGKPVGRTVVPTTAWVDEARELTVDGSVYESLHQAAVPAVFAVEMARLLNETYDVRRDLRGGERLQVLWSRQVLEDGSPIGLPRLSYIALDAAESRLEIVWSQEDRNQTTLYEDGEVSRSFLMPVESGRLSSTFGPRKHPIYADVRLHAGVDFAAALGAPIVTTASGDVSFIGWRSGYGRVVEISHGSDIITRYAHLNAVAEGLALGDRVSTGTVIGEVGETGTTTSPNLHYEVRVADQPVDPLLGAIDLSSDVGAQDATTQLAVSRTRFATTLDGSDPGLVAERS